MCVDLRSHQQRVGDGVYCIIDLCVGDRLVEVDMEVEVDVEGSCPMVAIERDEEVVLTWNNGQVRQLFICLVMFYN